MPKPGLLVIVRHGESEWNARGVWTGTTDVHLTEKGRRDAALIGVDLKDIHFDRAYVSGQVRTHETLAELLRAAAQTEVPTDVEQALNERDYGVFTGKNKWEVKSAVGDEAFNGIRRGWDNPVEGGETLKDVYERAVPFYTAEIVPKLVAGETVLLVAHGNSIRSLVKYIEKISDEGISSVEMIFGTALLYTVDNAGYMTSKTIRKIDITPPPA